MATNDDARVRKASRPANSPRKMGFGRVFAMVAFAVVGSQACCCGSNSGHIGPVTKEFCASQAGTVRQAHAKR